MGNENLTRKGLLAVLFTFIIGALGIEVYGVLLTIFHGEASRWGNVFHSFENFIKWTNWTAGVLAVIYVAFSSHGKIKYAGIAGVAIAGVNIVIKLVDPQTHYSEHVFNGLTILGLALAIYKDMDENLK